MEGCLRQAARPAPSPASGVPHAHQPPASAPTLPLTTHSTHPPRARSCGSGKPRAVTLFVSGTLLGREACPWPMILPGNDGYDPAFDFTKVSFFYCIYST